MAAARTHFAIATSLAGLAGTCLLVVGLAQPREAILYLVTGALGGYLPDVDADNSRPLKLAFHCGAILLAFLALFAAAGRFSVAELGVLWAAVYLVIRVVAVKIFERLTVHRGLFHSVPAATLFAAATALLGHRWFGLPPRTAWWAALFLGAGYLGHLLLDELHALNWFGVGTRRSLGSALKLWSRSNPRASVILWGLALVCVLASPNPSGLLAGHDGSEPLATLSRALLPHNGWFSDLRLPLWRTP